MFTPVLLAEIPFTAYVIGGVIAVVIVLFMLLGLWASRYTKVGPNQVLVISGRKRQIIDPDGTARDVGFRIVKGGGRFVWPVYEKVDILSLELLTIDVQTPEVYTSKGVPVKVDGVAQIKVKGDDVSIATASEQFLSKGVDDIKNIATQTLEGHLRAILGTMTVEEIYQNRASPRSNVMPSSPRPRPTAIRRSVPRRRSRPGRKRSSPPIQKLPRRNAITNRTSRNTRPR